LEYKVNGLNAYILTHVLYIVGSFGLGIFEPTIIYDNWQGLLFIANIYGVCLALFAYIKAHLFPTHPEDCKFSGSIIYDFCMGIEFNPRFGKLWDFKLFHNGRPGIIAWTLINISFAAA
jgi:7-dehydrocholesterol reductase